MATSKPLVLIVDNEPQMCDVLRRILEKEGYAIITAFNGEEALRLVREKKPDVILLDLVMPGIDGREVCQRIRKFSTTSRIIYLTAKATPANSSQSKELYREADAFIAKPATSKQILSKVSSVLQSADK